MDQVPGQKRRRDPLANVESDALGSYIRKDSKHGRFQEFSKDVEYDALDTGFEAEWPRMSDAIQGFLEKRGMVCLCFERDT